MRGRAARFIPCTALGVIELLQRSSVAVRGKSVVVMGDSNIVGMPLAMLFRDAGAATVTVLHRTSYGELFADSTSAEVHMGSTVLVLNCLDTCSAFLWVWFSGCLAGDLPHLSLLPNLWLQRANQRAQAAACLPRIPGPVAAHAAGSAATGSSVSSSSSGSAGHPAASEQPAAGGTGRSTTAHYHPYEVQRHTSILRGVESAQPPVPSPEQQGQPREDAAAAPHNGWQAQSHHGGHHPHPHISDLPSITRTGDILVVAVGYPQLVKREWVKPGAVVIDVGVNVVSRSIGSVGFSSGEAGSDSNREQQQQGQAQQPAGAAAAAPPATEGETAARAGPQHGSAAGMPPCLRDEYAEEGAQLQQPWHVVGDVDFWDVAEVASALTPVPGGVGPMTIAAVLHNTVQAARYNLGLASYAP